MAFRRDNLSSDTELRYNWRFPLQAGTIESHNLLNYKLFQKSSALDPEYSLEDRFDLSYKRPLGNRRQIGARIEYNLFQDRRTGLGSDLSNTALLATFGSSAQSSFRNEAALGLRSSQRYGLLEKGPTVALSLGKVWNTGEHNLSTVVDGNADFFQVNENQQFNAMLGYRASFGERAFFHTGINRRERQQEFFTDSLRSSQSRQILDIKWQNRFGYMLSDDLELFHRLDYVEQATSIERWREEDGERERSSNVDRSHISLVNETGLELMQDLLQARLTFRVDNTQNKYYVDHNQVLYQLKSNVAVQPAALVDSLRWIGILIRQKYDTPDTTNDDDRDEFRFSNSLEFSWQPNPFLRTSLGAKLNVYHLVYLFNTRSSENHWNRSLILWNRVAWQHGPWSSLSTGRVHANYFDYDYDDLFVELDQPLRSFVHRSLELEEVLTRRLGQNWSLTGRIDLKWEDDGRLDWDSFVQEVQSDRIQQEYVLLSNHRLRSWEFWYGYLVHTREKVYTDPGRDNEIWEGQGPVIGWKQNWFTTLQFTADMRFIQVRDQDNEYLLPKVSVRASWLP